MKCLWCGNETWVNEQEQRCSSKECDFILGEGGEWVVMPMWMKPGVVEMVPGGWLITGPKENS